MKAPARGCAQTLSAPVRGNFGGGRLVRNAGVTRKFTQRGYVGFPKEALQALFWLAAVGLAAIVGLGLYGLWWLLTNVSIAIGG